MILLNELTSEVINICPIYGLILNSDGTITIDFDPSASPTEQTNAINLVGTYSGNVTSDIGYSPFAPETINSILLASGSVISGKLGNYVINPINISSGSVLSGHIGNAAINSNNIASGAINANIIGPGVIVSGSIASGAVGQFHLSSGAVNSGHLGNNSVVSGSIASGQIGLDHLASGVLDTVAFTINNASDNRIITSLNSGSKQANAEANLTYDGTTLNIQSVGSGSTVFSVDGVSGNLFSINDISYGENILSVENLSGSLIFGVSSEGYQKTLSCVVSGKITNTGIFAIPKIDGNAIFFDYHCKNTLSTASRAGSISAVWDESNDSIEYTETSTNDINGSTEHLYFSTEIETTGSYSGKMVLSANISSGSWNIKVSARVI